MSRKPIQFEGHPVSFEQARDMGLQRCVIGHVVDGDTWDLFIDLGYGEYGWKPIRLVGDNPKDIFDTYELRTPTGEQAREYVINVVAPMRLLCKSYRDSQTFERWLAQVFLWDDEAKGPMNVTVLLDRFRKPKGASDDRM